MPQGLDVAMRIGGRRHGLVMNPEAKSLKNGKRKFVTHCY
jgi:hypothetical protein